MQTENGQGLLRRSDALTLEEIQASTDLSGKIASASALNNFPKYVRLVYKEFSHNIVSQEEIIPIPNFSKFAEINIMLSHVQSLYGRVMKFLIVKHDIYFSEVILSDVSSATNYNDFTYVGFDGSGYIKIAITTGSVLSHTLTADAIFY